MNVAKSTSKRTDVSRDAFATDATISEYVGVALATPTPAHQHMAGYVLANPFHTTTMRIDEFAATVDMSIATANRSALASGSDGYLQFHAGLLHGFETTLTPVKKLRRELTCPVSSAETSAASLSEDIASLDITRHMLSAAACERAVDAILDVQRIYVMGFGASDYLAGLLRHGLDLYRDTVIAVSRPSDASDAARQLHKIGPKDLLIVITFSRHVADIITLTKQAGKQGCQLLALIDSPTSSLAPLADIALYARPEQQFSATSNTAAVALFEALCGATAHRSMHSLESAERPTEFTLP